MDNNFFEWKDGKIYLIIIGILIVIIAIYQPILASLLAIAIAYVFYKYIVTLRDKKREWTKYIEGLAEEFDSATKHAVFNMPFPLVMLDINGVVIWYNTRFINMMPDKDILNKKIEEFLPMLKVDKILKSLDKKPIEIGYNNNHYKIYYNIIDDRKSISTKEGIIILYWVDRTDEFLLQQKYNEEKTAVCLAYIDNFDEVKGATPEVHRPLVLAEIDKIINLYANVNGGLVRKYENDKYVMIFKMKDLLIIQDKKFDILDQIREIDKGNIISITLSMGVGLNGDNPGENYESAKAAIDIALGRGGDQVVVKKDNELNFYGGKTKAVEKRNKVKSRVISHALMQLIDQSKKVFIMGHKNPDMDSFGASIGIIRAVNNRGRDAYFVLSSINPSIKNIYERMAKEQPEYLNIIVSPEKALDMIDGTSLLIIVDNHRPNFTEAPELLDLTDKLVLIDHHRRGAEFIKSPILTYLEPYASSTCELVTEMLYYMSDKMGLTEFEADALLAGIAVDTKNFTFQTGVRTFEAASILKRAGANTTNVRQFFRDDFDLFLHKAEVIKNSKIVFNKIAIGQLDRDMDDSILIAAQSANDLLSIRGIEASFVLTLWNEQVHISGRSLGNISVQLILESMGGGGHLTSAGVQIAGITLGHAEQLLIEAIDKYLKEGDEE